MVRKSILLLLFSLFAVVIIAPIGAQQVPAQPEVVQPEVKEQAQPQPPPQTATPPTSQVAPTPAEPQAVAPPAPQVAPPPRPPERRIVPPPTAARSADMVSLNFNRAELVEVIHVLAQHLKLTYTIDPEVRGTVTIYSAEPLKKDDLLPVFHQVLRMNNAVAVKTGELYRIAPIKEGKSLARPVGQGKEDSYALQVVPVRFFSVAEMKKLLTPFVSPGGEMLDYPRGNFLIIVDLPSNIQKLLEIRDLIDVQVFAGTRMEIYQPKVASAEELAAEMTKLMQAYASSAAQAEGFAAQFLPLPRINQILVISHSEAAWTYVKRWLEKIDTTGEGPGRRIFIYPVENGKATDLADVLSQALGRPPVARRETPRTLQDLHRGTQSGSGTTGAQRGGTQPGTQPQGLYAVVPVPPEPPPRLPGAPPPPRPEAKPEEQLRIVPDPATNSLIIYGTAQEFQNIKNILKELDLIPRQVLLDVLIVEVTLKDNLTFGVEWEIRRGGRSARIFDRTFGSSGAILSGILPPAAATGLTKFPPASGLSSVITPGNDVRAFINALMTDSRLKVLSSPTVLATDNHVARIQVGTDEPIASGIIQTAVGVPQVASSTTIQYKPTGRLLSIIPQVNSQGLVNLQIIATVSQRDADVSVGGSTFPSFSTREAETVAVVQDGETLVIGGIITEKKERGRTGIPYLMDIPVLGRFFGTTIDKIDRTELVMLITPHVIRNVEEARSVTDEFKEKLSTVAREIERMRQERERQKKEVPKKEREEKEPTPQEPSSPPAPETESRKAPEQSSGFYQDRPADKQEPQLKMPVQAPPPGSSVKAPPQEEVTSNYALDRGLATPEAITEKSFDEVEPVRTKIEAPPARETKTPVEGEKGTPVSPRRVTERVGTPAHQGVWAVQVSAFPDERISSNLVKRLASQGYDAYIVRANIKGQTWYRVRVGRLATREQAKELQETLKTNKDLTKAFIVRRYTVYPLTPHLSS